MVRMTPEDDELRETMHLHDRKRPGPLAIRLLSAGLLLLMAVTWWLWIPQQVFPQFPRIAALAAPALQWGALVAVVLAGLGLLIAPGPARRSGGSLILCGGLGLLFLADRNRLQPWAWQVFLLSLTLGLTDDRRWLSLWRGLVITIYAWSALWKCDPLFLMETGPRLLQPFWSRLQALWPHVLPVTVPGVALGLLPLLEGVAAVGLASRRFRRYGLWLSWLMHGSLLLLLGPFGAGHSAGVLGWNLFFMIQNACLFARPTTSFGTDADPDDGIRPPSPHEARFRHVGNAAAIAIMLAAGLWPLAYPWGGCDAWPAWSVYTPPLQQVWIWIPRSAVPNLPPAARAACVEPSLQDIGMAGEWAWDSVLVEPNRWSLTSLGVPVYPSPRVRLQVALDLTDHDGINDHRNEDNRNEDNPENDVRVMVTPWRFLWQPQYGPSQILTGREEIAREID